MKNIKDSINEAKLSFDIKRDIYNALEELAYTYERKGREFNKQEVEESVDWFIMEFFEL